AKLLGLGTELGGVRIGRDVIGLLEAFVGDPVRLLLGGRATGCRLDLGTAGSLGVLARALLIGDGLLALSVGARGTLLLRGLAVRLAKLVGRFLALGVGHGLLRDGFLAVACLRLLELSLLDEVVLAAHGAG